MRLAIGTLVLVLILGVLVPATGIESIPVPEPEPELAIQVEPSQGERTLICKATAYYYGHITKTGTKPVEGRTIAVDPAVIPLGSQVYVSCETWPEVDGVYTAEDTGRLVKGRIIDIYMNDHEKCIQWGRRLVEVKVIE